MGGRRTSNPFLPVNNHLGDQGAKTPWHGGPKPYDENFWKKGANRNVLSGGRGEYEEKEKRSLQNPETFQNFPPGVSSYATRNRKEGNKERRITQNRIMVTSNKTWAKGV